MPLNMWLIWPYGSALSVDPTIYIYGIVMLYANCTHSFMFYPLLSFSIKGINYYCHLLDNLINANYTIIFVKLQHATDINFSLLQSVSDNDVRNVVLSYLMHNCFKETAEAFLSSTGLNLPVDYSVDVDKRKGIYLQVNTGSFLHYYVLGGALLVILHDEVLFVCFDKFTATFLVVCSKQALRICRGKACLGLSLPQTPLMWEPPAVGLSFFCPFFGQIASGPLIWTQFHLGLVVYHNLVPCFCSI
jgi:hypothetical protein